MAGISPLPPSFPRALLTSQSLWLRLDYPGGLAVRSGVGSHDRSPPPRGNGRARGSRSQVLSGPRSGPASLHRHFCSLALDAAHLRAVILPSRPLLSSHLLPSCVTIGMLNILIAQLTITYDKLTADKEGFAMKYRSDIIHDSLSVLLLPRFLLVLPDPRAEQQYALRSSRSSRCLGGGTDFESRLLLSLSFNPSGDTSTTTISSNPSPSPRATMALTEASRSPIAG
eukprot:766173-Hanusia_phi.AAC.3